MALFQKYQRAQGESIAKADIVSVWSTENIYTRSIMKGVRLAYLSIHVKVRKNTSLLSSEISTPCIWLKPVGEQTLVATREDVDDGKFVL